MCHVIQGLLLANHVSDLVKLVLNMHVALAKPMTKSTVLSVCRLVELIKV